MFKKRGLASGRTDPINKADSIFTSKNTQKFDSQKCDAQTELEFETETESEGVDNPTDGYHGNVEESERNEKREL